MKVANKFQHKLYLKTYNKIVIFAYEKAVITKVEDILQHKIHKLNQIVVKYNFKIAPGRAERKNLV
jgi:hypothetical protein